MVGNYPNPRWYDGQPFATYPKGEFIFDAISREAFEDAVGAIVRDQEVAGMDIISDGKVYGGDSPYGQIVYHYAERLSGYKLSGPPIGLPIYSTLYAPTCVGEVRREYPFHMAGLRAVRKATKKPVKISFTGIQVLAAASNNQYYKETKELALAISKAFNEEFKELADNGCDIIQLDEFVWPSSGPRASADQHQDASPRSAEPALIPAVDAPGLLLGLSDRRRRPVSCVSFGQCLEIAKLPAGHHEVHGSQHRE